MKTRRALPAVVASTPNSQQHAPRATAAQDEQDRVDDLAQIDPTHSTKCLRRRIRCFVHLSQSVLYPGFKYITLQFFVDGHTWFDHWSERIAHERLNCSTALSKT